MKKFIGILLATLMALSFAAASAETEVPDISSQLFASAKQALISFSTGDFEGASGLLGFADADELSRFATGNFTTLGDGVQTRVSVAYLCGGKWKLAVPLKEPASGDIETLILISDDGSGFTGYQYALWSDVESEYMLCDYVVWNEEYVSATPYIIE